MNIAPWTDFKGDEITEGCIIAHPSGEQGKVVYHPNREHPSDQWTVDYGTGVESRLVLQIGDRGQAIRI